jgi:hypothetical protein
MAMLKMTQTMPMTWHAFVHAESSSGLHGRLLRLFSTSAPKRVSETGMMVTAANFRLDARAAGPA